MPNCGIINILNSKGTVKEAEDPSKNYYCFYDLQGIYIDECVENSDNIKKCMNDIKNITQPPLSDEKVWDVLNHNGILPQRNNKTFPVGIYNEGGGECIVPDKYLKNPPEKVDIPTNQPNPSIDKNLNNILNNIFNNKNFDINQYKDELKYLNNIKPEDIKKNVSSYIQNIKTNGSYKDVKQNIINVFNILNNNKDVIDLTINFSVDIINDLEYLFNEINDQMELSDSQKFNLDINNFKNNLVAKLKNTDTDSDSSNCKIFSTESIIIISILTFLLILFSLLWMFKK